MRFTDEFLLVWWLLAIVIAGQKRHRTPKAAAPPPGTGREAAMAGRAPPRAEGYGMDVEDEGEDIR